MRIVTKWMLMFVVLLFGVAYAEELPEGKFVFSAPALFGSADGEARGKLCELEVTEEGYQLVFLNNPLSRGSRIVFSLEGDRIVFDDSHMPSTEIGRTITGKGRLQDVQTASGKLTVSMGGGGFLLAKRKSSEWSLRPATRGEVLESFSEGLKKAEELIWGRRSRERPTRENAIKALNSVVGYGFTRKDIPELKRMLESGDLNYKDGKFFFRQTSPVTAAASALPISTNVYSENIDLRENIHALTNRTMEVVEASPSPKIIAPAVVSIPVAEETVTKQAAIAPAVVKDVDLPVPQDDPISDGCLWTRKWLVALFVLIIAGIATTVYYKKRKK